MRFSALFFVLLVVTGCDSNKLYDNAIEFKDRSWKVSEPVEHEFVVTNIGERYDISCTLRNSLDYPYARVFINYSLMDSTGQELSKKMIAEYLFDQKTGEPKGSSGLGDIYDHRFLLLPNYEFKNPGKYKVKLDQMMRQDTLTGVLAVGILVEKTPAADK